jgi:hypothetical protein
MTKSQRVKTFEGCAHRPRWPKVADAMIKAGQSLEKSSPDYEALCNYGIIADEAA